MKYAVYTICEERKLPYKADEGPQVESVLRSPFFFDTLDDAKKEFEKNKLEYPNFKILRLALHQPTITK